jgi:hypothetical protein
MTKRSLFLVAAVASRNPISTDGKVHHAAGEVESVVNIILQRPLAAHAQHLRVLQPMLAAAPDAEALLTGPLSPAKLLQDEGIMKSFRQDFEMDSRHGRVINSTVFRRNLESVLHYPGCTAFADREQLPQLLKPLVQEQRLALHFSRSNCDPTWMGQVLLSVLRA